jgi:hypothetical protein
MHVSLGPWADPRVTDTRMLLNLARLDGDAAVGVLANPNLTDDDVAQVIGYANLTSKNLQGATGAVINCARTTDQYLNIVEATRARSKPAAKHLVRSASPAAALAMLKIGMTENTRAARFLKDEILESVRSLRWHIPDEDTNSVFELYLTALPELDGADLVNAYEKLTTAATTVEHLRDLTGTFDQIERLDELHLEHAIQALLLATLPHPDVVEEWAQQHRFGRLVAQQDNRHVYQGMTDLDLDSEIRGFAGTSLRFDMISLLLQMREPSVSAVIAVLESLNGEPHKLALETRKALWEQVTKRHATDLPVDSRAARWHGELRTAAHRGGHRAEKPPSELDGDIEKLLAMVTRTNCQSGYVVHRYSADGLVRAQYDIVHHRLKTAEHWMAYDELCREYVATRTVLGALETVAARHIVAAPDTGPRYVGLFGNPLGDLN